MTMIVESDVDSEIISRVRRMIARQLDICPSMVSPSARFREDLGADSLESGRIGDGDWR